MGSQERFDELTNLKVNSEQLLAKAETLARRDSISELGWAEPDWIVTLRQTVDRLRSALEELSADLDEQADNTRP